MALADKFRPYCDNEYANRDDNAENCADVNREVAKDFMFWSGNHYRSGDSVDDLFAEYEKARIK